ncbi:MAG TPA: hypothetical protein VGE37_05420, partial [Archangium sp.]
FQRRKERFWAWRAQPSRPATYLLVLVLCFGLFVTVVAPRLTTWAHGMQSSSAYADPSLMDPDADE